MNFNFFTKIFKKKFICPGAFSQVYIYPDGRVFLCPDCLMTSDAEIGNLYNETFDKIWNSKKAINIRKKILKGEYLYCNVRFCASRSNFNYRLVPFSGLEYKKTQKTYPKMVCIGADSDCNVNCIMCRPEISKMSKDELDIFGKRITDLYLPILKDANELTVSTTGDPFASKNTKELMKKAAETYPNLKFNIITNGILCNKASCDEIAITERLSRVMVSIHSSTEETYKKIVKNGNYARVIENISWLMQLKEIGMLKDLFFAFVISSKNYEDIPLFIDFAKRYGAEPLFWSCIDWGGNLDFSDEPLDILNPSHPKHNYFLAILNSEKVKAHKSYFSVNVRNLIN